MQVKTVVSMDSDGRLTIPAAARSVLHVEGAVQFEIEVVGDALILRPIAFLEEDAWAYAPEHVARLERARQQARAGQTHALSEAELERRATH
jgi:bifunctional DNA-binding transcriptional regulator/antitoxin component of YhaV-PrlF toxin-antitoxin module